MQYSKYATMGIRKPKFYTWQTGNQFKSGISNSWIPEPALDFNDAFYNPGPPSSVL